MNKGYILPLVVLSLMVLNGCSNPKDASESNFKAAAQQYLDAEYPYCYYISNFPITSDKFGFMNPSEGFHVLSQKGLLTEKEISRKHIEASGFSQAHDNVITEYNLTDKGKKYYKTDARKGYDKKSLGGFCFGKANISEVSNFTEPSDMMGQRISRVTYSYEVTDIPDWAKSPEMLALNDKLKEDVNSQNIPIKKTGTFILTSKGWVHERLFGK